MKTIIKTTALSILAALMMGTSASALAHKVGIVEIGRASCRERVYAPV